MEDVAASAVDGGKELPIVSHRYCRSRTETPGWLRRAPVKPGRCGAGNRSTAEFPSIATGPTITHDIGDGPAVAGYEISGQNPDAVYAGQWVSLDVLPASGYRNSLDVPLIVDSVVHGCEGELHLPLQ